TDSRVSFEPLKEDYVKKFIGGSGIAAKILYDELDPYIDPLIPENKLVFMTGPLTGSLAPGCGRFVIASKSPLTGIWGEAGSAGYWGPELKFAGYDGSILEGRAENPIYLWINNENVELRDAEHLWGKDTIETENKLKSELKEPRSRIVTIGPSGERLAKIACIVTDGGVAGRCGLGAVMGSKKLKAIAVRGTERVEVADEASFRGLVEEISLIIENNPRTKSLRSYGSAGSMEGNEVVGDVPIKNWMVDSWSDGAKKLSGQYMAKTILKRPVTCFACPIACKREIELKSGPYAGVKGKGPEYETCASFGTMLLIDDIEVVAKANDLCTRCGMDTISCGSVIAFAYECYEKGLIKNKDVEGLNLSWGNNESFLKMIEMIGKRKGIGFILGEGVKIASEKIGKEAEKFAIHVKGLEMPMHDPRAYKSLALGYATSSRGACHLQATSHWVERGMLFPEIGIKEKPDRFTSEGKAKMVIDMQNFMAVIDSLIICKFALTCGYTLTHLLKLIYSATRYKINVDEFKTAGERIFNLKRLFNNRLGISRKDDRLPDRINKPLPERGAKHKSPDLDLMLDEYYQLRGWDEEGRPTTEKLTELEL
ncbi:MAG: aldehyde ferredoxin oxidoreductase family protein, partial [archaeon]|nr:aldehyde ferredoxin oxidoreductase family protein [archaeon]